MTPELEAEFEAFVRASSPALLRTAVLLVGRDAAPDLLQSVLERAALRWGRLRADAGGQPHAWVRRALANESVDRWRRRRVRPVEVLPGELPDRGPASEDQAQVDLRDELLGGLRRLPPRQRAVLVLRYFEDLSEAEIADTLGISPGTVKSQAAKALRSLRVTLHDTEDGQVSRP